MATGATLRLGSASVLDSTIDTVIDSGATIIYGPPEQVEMFYRNIEGAGVFDKENGFYGYPCDKKMEVSFDWGGREWAVSEEK